MDLQTEFDKVFPLMTRKEQDQLFIYSYSGMWDRSSNTVYMGMDAMDRVDKFKQEMVDKYGHRSD
jgi:hypothetical protein